MKLRYRWICSWTNQASNWKDLEVCGAKSTNAFETLGKHSKQLGVIAVEDEDEEARLSRFDLFVLSEVVDAETTP